MKSLFGGCILFLLSLPVFSADVKVDNTGAVAGSHTTIQAAVNAAANGDRVVIFTSEKGNYYEDLTLNKSLTLLCATEEEYFFLTGNITITPANGREITIVGMYQNGNILSASANPVGARCIVNVVDCDILGSVLFSHDGFDVNLLYNRIVKTVELRHGKFIANELGRIYDDQSYVGELKITEENISYGVGDTVFIIANRITRGNNVPLLFNHANARYFIANNSIRNLYNNGTSGRSSVKITACLLTDSANAFLNNYLMASEPSSGSFCNASSTGASAELKGIRTENLVNNIFYNQSNSGCALLGMRGDYNYLDDYDSYPATANQYDNILSYYSSPNITFDQETGKVTAGDDAIDKGKPGVAYMDIDLTRNDLGTYGGPYSQENYWDAANPQGGRARVFMLDMASKVYSLTSPTVIKAGSTHTK